MIQLRDVVLIHDLKRQGLSVSAIARQIGCDRKTVRKYLEAGLEPPIYGPRPPRGSKLDGYHAYLRDRVFEFPELSGRRLFREVQSKGYEGSYSTVKTFLREVRPPARALRTSELPDSDFAKSRTAISVIPGQFGHG